MARAAVQRRLIWRSATILDNRRETPRVHRLVLDVPGWPGHLPGQHVVVRLTAEDGYVAQRSYSLASPPDVVELHLTVERLDGGEVSPYLTEEVRRDDMLELRGPIGGYHRGPRGRVRGRGTRARPGDFTGAKPDWRRHASGTGN
jgi:ferredoxin-NADP reductase